MRFRPLLAALTAATLLGGAATAAAAQTATTVTGAARLATLKARGDTEIDRRLADLDGLTDRIDGDHRITAAQKGEVLAMISSTRSGLTTLKVKIDGDTDLTTLRTDLQAIVLEFRVYVLVDPQVHEIVAADEVLDVSAVLTGIEAKLSPFVTRLNQPAVSAALSDAEAKTTAATAAVQALPATLAALTPSGYPGNASTLKTARTSLATARSDLGAARRDLQTVVQALTGATSSTTSTTA